MPADILRHKKGIKIFTWFLIINLQFAFLTAWGQDNLDAITTVFSNYQENSIQEKLFVHTDKTFYLAGEIAWFKIYDVNASSHRPLELSKVAYVEILDSVNKPRLQAKIAINKAEGTGSFYLPLTLGSGNYKLRAYTNWMKNFDAAYFFEKNISIVNVQKPLTTLPGKQVPNIDVQFFPEGGNLVNGLPCRIAFKGTDQYGKGITFTGVLLDNADTLFKFSPRHAGMGSFYLTPLSNHTYKAVIQRASGQAEIKDLPVVRTGGYVVNVGDSAGKIRVLVRSDISSAEIYLFVHTRGLIKAAAMNFLQDGRALFLLDRQTLGDGISHITIFNNRKQPVCERLYFKKPLKQLDIKLNTNQPQYATRRKVSINIQPGNTGIINDSSSLSLSVYRLDSLQSIDLLSINSYLLLNADLRGFIEDPDYYFLREDAEFDDLMLVNGWRRFKWEEIEKNSKPYFDYVPEYNGHIITGKVINNLTGKPANGIESFISVPGSTTAFSTSFSNEEGRVTFELHDLFATPEIILQPNTFRDSLTRINVTDPFSTKFSANPFPVFTLEKNKAQTLLEQSISMQVQNIYSAKSLQHFIAPEMDSSAFYRMPDARYSLDNYTRFTTVEEVLREYVSLVDVKKREGRFHFSIFDVANSQMFKSDPLVLLDGVPVFDLNKFMLIDPLKLNTLEVITRKYFLGNSKFNGILNWTSYKRDMAGYDAGAHATIIDYEGLQMEREFYAPVYNYDDQLSSHLPDFRNVLLWSPDIKIANGGSKEIVFYTSDLPGRYAVQVNGLTKNGLSGSATATFDVKK